MEKGVVYIIEPVVRIYTHTRNCGEREGKEEENQNGFHPLSGLFGLPEVEYIRNKRERQRFYIDCERCVLYI